MTLRTITLYGPMRARFGRTFRFHLDSNTVAEAIRALCSQLKGFEQYLANAHRNGVGFAVFTGKRNLTIDDLGDRFIEGDIRVAPVTMGSKGGGIFNVILGTALIAASVFVPFLAPISPLLLHAGIGLVAGGVIQMLTPVPKGVKNADASANAPSYVFNGAVNTTAQNNPVPVLYGRMIVGSAVISAGIDAEDYAPTSATTSPISPGVSGGNSKSTPYQ